MSLAKLPVGQRIKHYRRKNGNRTQAAIAGLCGITERYLQQIEAGQKMPSAAVLARIAGELGVPLAALLVEDPADETSVPVTAAPEIARALTGYGLPMSAGPATPVHLRERVEAVWRSWQTSKERFSEAAGVLPDLIADVEHAVRVHRHGTDAQARREVLRVAADLYGLLRSYCRRAGRLDLSLMVADRAIRAAEDADDPVRMAAAQWNLGHVLLSHQEAAAVEEAKEIAVRAIEQLGRMPSTEETVAVEGALQLVAAVSDANRRRWWDARRRLEDRAVPLARTVGEGSNVQWTAFGPANVRMHAMSIEMLAGEASEGLRLADRIDTGVLCSRERQFTFGLELARCYDLRREDAAVLVHLLDLEEVAPEDLARSPLARSMVLGLQKRVRPTLRRQVDDLAGRLQLF
ncbi:helix-turn-helix transcriptional regulator [Streptomyces sp. NPDC004237]|uniref:helix-turn-helix domain-containing protein n=1 Tax=Streptomyces sp. NPDC004237 TaxID=3154455 RepID=UPI0033B8B591